MLSLQMLGQDEVFIAFRDLLLCLEDLAERSRMFVPQVSLTSSLSYDPRRCDGRGRDGYLSFQSRKDKRHSAGHT